MKNKQWRCFHCDQVFRSPRAAKEHFGDVEYVTPACQISHAEGSLITYIRRLEAEIESYRNDAHETLRAAYAIQCEAAHVARKAEEEGYNRGVSDMHDLGFRSEPEVAA